MAEQITQVDIDIFYIVREGREVGPEAVPALCRLLRANDAKLKKLRDRVDQLYAVVQGLKGVLAESHDRNNEQQESINSLTGQLQTAEKRLFDLQDQHAAKLATVPPGDDTTV